MSHPAKYLLTQFFSSLRRSSQAQILARRASSNTAGKPVENNEPIKFSQTKAAHWKAHQSFGGGVNQDMPTIQPFAVAGSIVAILVWFCILREENDMDRELGKTLYQRVPGMEQKQIELSIRYNEEKGLDSADLKTRLAEIESDDRKQSD